MGEITAREHICRMLPRHFREFRIRREWPKSGRNSFSIDQLLFTIHQPVKRCPQCDRVETDDSLAFCRADGTALISDPGSISRDAGTAKFDSGSESIEIETSILPPTSTTPEINRATAPTTVLRAAQIPRTTRELSRQKRRWVVIAPIAVAVIVISIAGYSYFSPKNNAAIQSI